MNRHVRTTNDLNGMAKVCHPTGFGDFCCRQLVVVVESSLERLRS